MNIAPIIGMTVGILMLIFVGYINWYGNNKEILIAWMAKKIFRDCLKSREMADSLFRAITSNCLGLGIILIATSTLFIK